MFAHSKKNLIDVGILTTKEYILFDRILSFDMSFNTLSHDKIRLTDISFFSLSVGGLCDNI
jgi:hypothetical protein